MLPSFDGVDMEIITLIEDTKKDEKLTEEFGLSLFEKLPELMWRRFSSIERLTLTHGDSHFWNFLYPNNTDVIECVIFDWSEYGI